MKRHKPKSKIDMRAEKRKRIDEKSSHGLDGNTFSKIQKEMPPEKWHTPQPPHNED